VLTLFATKYSPEEGISGITKADLTPVLTRVERFLSASIEQLHAQLEESSDVYDVAREICDAWSSVRSVRIVLLTNSQLRTAVPSPKSASGKELAFDVWDIDRLERLMTSGRVQEPLNVDVAQFGLEGLQAMGPFGGDGGFAAYLIVVPAPFLAGLYETYGPRLLELNVRSFLQARGKTNQGIQLALKNEPERFLAYNNGLSMTAAAVEVRQNHLGQTLVVGLYDLQIVNGGQTTASIYHASRKLGTDVSRASVQAKLTVLDANQRAELAPLISRFANTQNPIRMADFSANDPFHVELEKLSRSIWAPAVGGTQQMTRWFYERARGQYADAVGRERTPSQKRRFVDSHPRRQMFAKTDVAKYENAWAQLPYLVALGAEKNFVEYSQRRAESKVTTLPDLVFFHDLVAKALMWRLSETQIAAMKLGGYRSAVVAYVISLVANRTSMNVDLDEMWREQDTSAEWKMAVHELAPLVHAALVRSAESRNVLEWAKKKECWAAIQEISWVPSSDLISNRKRPSGRSVLATSDGVSSLPASPEEVAGREIILRAGADTWFELATWAKQTNTLQPWQRGLAGSIARYIADHRDLSAKQVAQGVIIMTEAARLGFNFDGLRAASPSADK
jgi:hypothetical protein